VNSLVPATPVMRRSKVDNLVALATDVLAQSEARQRAARRLHQTINHMSEAVRETGGIGALDMQKVREHTTAIRNLGEIERNLLDEFDSALSQIR
jgi:hypothetical protein